ncbi:hypothetical protein TNCV_3797721 [Trichonephila clavipes]|nr:hypothetical protein TNCV_3797721 [Trichonephila clavipes]
MARGHACRRRSFENHAGDTGQRYQANGLHSEVMAFLLCPKPVLQAIPVLRLELNTAFVNNQGERSNIQANVQMSHSRIMEQNNHRDETTKLPESIPRAILRQIGPTTPLSPCKSMARGGPTGGHVWTVWRRREMPAPSQISSTLDPYGRLPP